MSDLPDNPSPSDLPAGAASAPCRDASLALEFLATLTMLQRIGERALAARPDEADALRAGVAAMRAALDALEAQINRHPDRA